MAVWNLREHWDRNKSTKEKLESFERAITGLADPEQVLEHLASSEHGTVPSGPLFAATESEERIRDAVSF
jgi:hypothetical protein